MTTPLSIFSMVLLDKNDFKSLKVFTATVWYYAILVPNEGNFGKCKCMHKGAWLLSIE